MHRDLIGHRAEPIRGLCSKQFVADLRGQGVGRDEAIEAVSQAFGVPRGAAEARPLASGLGGGRGPAALAVVASSERLSFWLQRGSPLPGRR